MVCPLAYGLATYTWSTTDSTGEDGGEAGGAAAAPPPPPVESVLTGGGGGRLAAAQIDGDRPVHPHYRSDSMVCTFDSPTVVYTVIRT